MSDIIASIKRSVVEGDNISVEQGVKQALASGVDAATILQSGLIPAMVEVGDRFESGEFFLPEMMTAARAMKTGLQLFPPISVHNIKPLGVVAIGTVRGDVHDIGKGLVAMMLEGVGLEVHDLGVDVPAEKFIKEVNAGAGIVALSALLSTTVPQMKGVIDELAKAGLRGRVKVLVGGSLVTQDYADEIGADAYAPDAASAARIAKQLATAG